MALLLAVAVFGSGMRHACTEPPAATTLLQSDSWEREFSVKTFQFFLNASRLSLLGNLPYVSGHWAKA